jgi:hypothetical protein
MLVSRVHLQLAVQSLCALAAFEEEKESILHDIIIMQDRKWCDELHDVGIVQFAGHAGQVCGASCTDI